ncbi:MAG: RNA polymerase sigma factor [Acidimicrobiales bacterium]
MTMSKYARPVVGAPEGGEVDLDRDRALVLRCQEGDGAAFAELYTQYHDRLHRFCMRRICDRDEAEEIAQEAFLRAWRALPTFSGGLRFYPWLTVIAKNLCTDALRKRARCGPVEDIECQSVGAVRLDPFSTTMSSEETVMATFDGELAAQALDRLSDRHRRVLRLREEHGLSYQEIATHQGVEVSTVETLLWRARQALKREYAALSGTRILGGLLIGGTALRRLAERFGRKASRLAMAFHRVNVRDVAAAGVITVALASASGNIPSAPSASALSSTSAAVPLSASTTTATVATPTPAGPSGIPTAPTSGGTPTWTTIPSITPSLPVPGAASLPSASGLSQVASQLPTIVAQVPPALSNVATTVHNVAGDIGQVLGGVPPGPTLPLPTPPLPNPSQTVPKVVTGAASGLGIGG